MTRGVCVLGGKCPGGKCPGGKCPGGMCPWGKCPGGTCPGGFCPVTKADRGVFVAVVLNGRGPQVSTENALHV